jgi:hypothetical protein
MRSRLQQKRRRQSRRRQSRRHQMKRGGRPELLDNKLWQVSYEVLCNEDSTQPEISASDLFSMVNTGLYDMATGHGDVAILGAENIVVSQLFNRERDAYRIQLDVSFSDKMDHGLNEWKAAYLAGIKSQELFLNGSFVPVEKSFFFEPIAEPEYPDWIEPSGEVRDV